MDAPGEPLGTCSRSRQHAEIGLKMPTWKSLATGLVRSQRGRVRSKDSRKAELFRTPAFKGTAEE